MSLSEKLIDVNLASLSKLSEVSKDLLLIRDVHLEAKSLGGSDSFLAQSL